MAYIYLLHIHVILAEGNLLPITYCANIQIYRLGTHNYKLATSPTTTCYALPYQFLMPDAPPLQLDGPPAAPLRLLT
jgi:hypothetical protein